MNLIHAGFLAAGLAVALPIVIHLLFRQRTRIVSIGSVQFLRQVVKDHRRRRRLRQWILLSLRMLAVMLLALLFARPYWDQSHRRGLDQEVVLLVDRSASMQARTSNGGSAFERAIATTRDEAARLDVNVIVHIALCDAAGIQEVAIDSLPQAIPSEAATDFALALSWAKDILTSSNRSTRRIVLVTDLQRSGLRTPPEHLPDGMEFNVRDVGDALPRNVAIESATALRTEIRPDSQVLVRAVVRNHGPLPVRNLQIRCDLQSAEGTQFKLDRSLDLAGHGHAVVDFPLAIDKDGLYKGKFAITSADALALDDTRWLAFEARHPERVLLVDGDEGRSVFNNETYFLETALRLQTEEASGQVRSFEPDRMVWESGEGFPRLDGYRAVILANVRRLSADDGRRMEAYVRGAGNLMIFAGDQVGRSSLAPLRELGLLPGPIADAPMERRLRIDRWETKHPALACFSDPQQGDLRRVEFHKLLPLTSIEEDARGLLFTGDTIVAAERSVGKGRCLYFGGTADRDWTELPRTPMYVPLMRQLLAYLTDQLADRSAVTSRLVGHPGETAGITPVADHEGHWLVINMDPRESALDRVSEEELQKVAGGSPSRSSETDLAAAGVVLPADSLRPDEIWTNVAWLLLAVLAAETLLASRVHA